MVSNADVPPGGEGKIEVKVSTKGRSGKLSKSITVETDDPVQPTMSLKVSANVIVDLDFERPYMRFDQVSKGGSLTRTVGILAKEPEKVRFGKIETDLEGLTAKVVTQKDPKGKDSLVLEMVYKPVKIGQYNGKLTVEALAPKKKTLSMNLSAMVEGDIVIQPTRLNIFADQPEKSKSSVVIKSAKGSFKIKSVVDQTGRLTAKVETLKKGFEYQVKVELTEAGKKESRSFSTKLIVTTNSKEQETLEIPVYHSTKSRNKSVAPEARSMKKMDRMKGTITPARKK